MTKPDVNHEEPNPSDCRLSEPAQERTADALLLEVFESSRVPMVVTDGHGLYERVNSAFCELMGYDQHELVGRSFLELTLADDRQAEAAAIEQIKASGRIHFREKRYLRKDGRIVHARVQALVTRDRAGRPVRSLAVIEDVTELVAIEAARRKAEMRLGLAIEAAGLGVFEWNNEDQWFELDAIAQSITGRKADQSSISIDEITAAMHQDDRTAFIDAMSGVRQPNGDNFDFECRWQKTGASQWVWLRLKGRVVQRDVAGRPVRIHGVVQDFTERRHTERALEFEQRLNQQIIQASPVGICIYESDGTCIAANPAMGLHIGASLEQVKAQNFHTSKAWKKSGIYELALRTLATGQTQSDLIHAPTSAKDAWLNASFIALGSGPERRLMVMVVDLTEIKHAEANKLEMQESYRQLFSNSMDGILLTYPYDDKVLELNPAASAMLGRTESEMRLQGRGNLLDTSEPHTAELLALRKERGWVRGEVPFFRANGEQFDVELTSTLYQDRNGKTVASTIFRDITERKKAEAETYRLAYFDSLTGLPNRRLLLDRLKKAMAAATHSGVVGALFFIDLDQFKKINDARGHPVGDQLLIDIANRLGRDLAAHSTLARVGGDEFVILVEQLEPDNASPPRAAMAMAEKLHQAIQQPIELGSQTYHCFASLGITLFPKGDENAEDLLREVDTAMHHAKAAGRNRSTFFDLSMHAEVEERLAMEQDLSRAIANDQFEAYVQPQFDASGREVGAELLLRWSHPGRGNVQPARFIPIAEQSGLMTPIGDWVIRQACTALARLNAAGAALTLSINVSPAQFHTDDFVERVRNIIADCGAAASQLIFEITEGLLIDNWEHTSIRMSELVAMGVRFSIDDFGTGYSSLAYLKKLPLYELKIDKSFVNDAPGDPNDRAIVQSILSVARILNLRVVAEGVETQTQADFLIAERCDCLQGYHYARPHPLRQWLERRLNSIQTH